MSDRPAALERLDRLVLTTTFAHEAAADLYSELAELGDGGDCLTLLRESATLTLERMPALMRPVRNVEREWEDQNVLDPAAAERTVKRLEDLATAVLPAFVQLRARQDEIIAELRVCAGDVD